MPLPGVASGAAKRCSAHSKRTGEQCKNPAITGRNTCRFHGGTVKAGPLSVNYKHGRYSKALPKRLAQRYEEAEQDPELLSLRSELSLIDTRLHDVLQRVDSGDSGRLWRAFKDEVEAQEKNVNDGFPISFGKLKSLLTQGRNDWMAWNEIITMIDNRRKLALAEAKRLETMQQMITAGEAMNYAAQLLESVRRNIDDPETLNRIQNDFARISQFTGD